jgi:hypothetical protein
MGDAAHGLRRKMNHPRYRRSGLSLVELLQCDGPEHHAHLLNTGPEDTGNCLLVLAGKLEVDGVSRHTPV